MSENWKKIGKIREVEHHYIAIRNYKITYYCDTKSTILNYRVYVWCSNT